jgi:hypothetical protein
MKKSKPILLATLVFSVIALQLGCERVVREAHVPESKPTRVVHS